MPLKTLVKASSITNLSDARYFSAFPVQWMSFHCHNVSNKYVPPQQIKEMIGWLEGPQFCLEVAGVAPAMIAHLLQQLDVQGLEVDATQSIPPELVKQYTIFRRLMVNKATTKDELLTLGRQVLSETDVFVLDFRMNNLTFTQLINGACAIQLEEVQALAQQADVLLDIDFAAPQVEQLLQLDIKGVNIPGGEEEKVGLRSFEDVQDTMEALERWD